MPNQGPANFCLYLAVMKSVLIILILFIVYGCDSSSYPVEDELYKCLVIEYRNLGIDINAVHDSLENHYIKEGILNSKSGKDKLLFYQQIESTGDIPQMGTYLLADSLDKVSIPYMALESCIMNSGVDSLLLKKSKYYKLRQEFKLTTEVNSKKFAQCHTSVLNKHDFEHPYYRGLMLTAYAGMYDY